MPGAALRAAALLIALGCAAPGALGAQGAPRQAVDSVLASYEQARSAYEASLGEQARLDSIWDDLHARLEEATAAADQRLTQRLRASIQDQSQVRTVARSERRKLEEAWRSEAGVLIGLIDAYIETIARRAQSVDADGRDDLLREADDMTQLRSRVRDEVPQESLEPPEMPNLSAQPGDGPTDLRRKATSYEEYAAKLDRLLTRQEDEMANLSEQQRRTEVMRGFYTGLDRLGGPPTGEAGTDRGSRVAASDTILAQMTRRIELLEQLRETTGARRDRARELARELRALAGGVR